MLHAYCDESYDGDIKNTPVYVVAGFIGNLEQWRLFEKLWCQSMRELRISDIGCHAAKCANGARPYKGMDGPRRAEIQYRLIVDIVASRLFGVVSTIDMGAYRSVKQSLSECLDKETKQYNEPHIHAVSQCVQHMCLVTEDVTDEPIAFVADRNDAFGKRAKAWYQVAVKNVDGNRHHKRLGPYAEDDRMRAVGLQAADMLAYAGMRHEAGRTGWQWGKMKEGLLINQLRTTSVFWDELLRRFRGEPPIRLNA